MFYKVGEKISILFLTQKKKKKKKKNLRFRAEIQHLYRGMVKADWAAISYYDMRRFCEEKQGMIFKTDKEVNAKALFFKAKRITI